MILRPAIAASALVCATVLIVSPALDAQTQVFRATAAQVSVSASVKKGNNVVANLAAKDFTLTDNGVAQTINAISMESVPVDVTLFLDTSGSTSGRLDEMKRDTQAIIKMLRPGDKFRLLVIGDSVYEAVPWVDAGTTVALPFQPVGGISLVQDALLMAVLHRVAPDRRHLVVGMTDSRDCGSVVSSAFLRELMSRSEAVVHVVDQEGSGGEAKYRVRTCTPRAAPNGNEVIREAIERTGGELHKGSFLFRSRSILSAFKKIFDDFRQSYVLRYSPEGVALPGWHAIQVKVPGMKDVVVRARAGYYGD
jgi:VWFA-related protein